MLFTFSIQEHAYTGEAVTLLAPYSTNSELTRQSLSSPIAAIVSCSARDKSSPFPYIPQFWHSQRYVEFL